MAHATHINWSNLTLEQASVLEALASKAGQQLLSDIAACDRRMAVSPDSNWARDAAAEKAMWERLGKQAQGLRAACQRFRIRRAA